MYESEHAEKKAENFFTKMVREIYSIRLFKKEIFLSMRIIQSLKELSRS